MSTILETGLLWGGLDQVVRGDRLTYFANQSSKDSLQGLEATEEVGYLIRKKHATSYIGELRCYTRNESWRGGEKVTRARDEYDRVD
jgi:hypothetical protein